MLKYFAIRRFNVIDGLVFTFCGVLLANEEWWAWIALIIVGILVSVAVELIADV